MKNFLGLLLLGIRLSILVRVSYLLYMTSTNPVEYPMDKLTWWVYFFIFEIWCSQIFLNVDKLNDKED